MTAALLALALVFPSADQSRMPPTLDGLSPLSLPLHDKPRKGRAQPYALLFGTVFDEGGCLIRGAQIEVRAVQSPRQGKARWESRTDSQGEFAVRLPAGKGVYTVEAHAPGLAPDRKEVEFSSDERVDVVLHLKRP